MTQKIHPHARDVAVKRLRNMICQELFQRQARQMPTDTLIKACVKRLDKPLAKALGDKEAVLSCCYVAWDSLYDDGYIAERETATKIMTRMTEKGVALFSQP